MSERRRLIKLARKIDPARLLEFVVPSEEVPSGHFLVGNEKDGYTLCCWHHASRLLETSIDDSVLAFAIAQHLKTSGMIFDTEREAEDFAIKNGWPGQ